MGDPNGIRTRVTAVKGRCPRPLDDRVTKPGNIPFVTRKANSGSALAAGKIDNQLCRAHGCAAMFPQYLLRIFDEAPPGFTIPQKLGRRRLERARIVYLNGAIL